MARMDHASTGAALVYLHDTDDRQRAIATLVSDLARPRAGAAERAVRREFGECDGHVRGTTASQVILVGEFSQVELRVELRGLEPPTPCLQSMTKMPSTIYGLARSVSSVQLNRGTSRRVGVGLQVSLTVKRPGESDTSLRRRLLDASEVAAEPREDGQHVMQIVT